MVSFELAGAAQREIIPFFEALRLCLPANTLGDGYTPVLHTAHSPHRALSPEKQARIAIGDGLVPMSVRIKAVEDILGDLEQALGP